MREAAIETHSDGDVIKVTASPIPDTATWTFSALVTWTPGTQQRVKLFLREERQFATEADAVRHGLEVATNWIIDGKPEQSSATVAMLILRSRSNRLTFTETNLGKGAIIRTVQSVAKRPVAHRWRPIIRFV